MQNYFIYSYISQKTISSPLLHGQKKITMSIHVLINKGMNYSNTVCSTYGTVCLRLSLKRMRNHGVKHTICWFCGSQSEQLFFHEVAYNFKKLLLNYSYFITAQNRKPIRIRLLPPPLQDQQIYLLLTQAIVEQKLVFSTIAPFYVRV